MGFYLNEDSKGNQLPAKGKAKALINDGAVILSTPEFVENLVCVVENAFFDAAGYCFSEHEFDIFKNDQSGRRKTWLTHPLAKELSGYKE